MYYIHHDSFIKSLFKQRHRSEKRHLLTTLLTAPLVHWDGVGFAFPREWFKRIGYSKTSFYDLNATFDLFEPYDGVWHEGSAMLWLPTDRYFELVDSLPPSPVFDATTRRRMSKPRHVLAPYAIGVDITAVDHFIAEGYKNLKPRPDSIFSVEETQQFWLGQAKKLRAITQNTSIPGCVPARYHRVANGRITGVGTGLQNVRKELRSAALNNTFDFDIENCHITIGAQMGHYPHFQEYAENTNCIRVQIAEDVGVGSKDVKKGVLALLNGASSDGPTFNKMFGEKRFDFYHHKIIKNLRKDIRAFKRNHHDVANTLQHEESRCLDAVRKSRKITLPMYDGFVASEDYECADIENDIYTHTGYRVTVTKDPIQYAVC